jgi:hypothetical protein
MRVIVTATNADGSASANSQPSERVFGTGAPRFAERVTITGTPRVGEELTATATFATTGGMATQTRYQWQRCDANGANCADIANATSRVYGVRSADQGNTLRVQATATNSAGEATSTSDRSNAVQAAAAGGGTTTPASPCTTASGTRIAAGTTTAVASVALPQRLIVSSLQFTPNPAPRTSTVTARFRVTDTCGRVVQGALVYVTGVPFGRIQNAAEVATGADGWATVTLRPTVRMPRPGEALQMFVRARKPGDSLLAGVSTRRLVQLRIAR